MRLLLNSAAYNELIMTSRNLESFSVPEMCARVKRLGYSASARVRLYGEEFEVLSDPFPEAGGIAVRAKSRRDATIRVLRLPATIFESASGKRSARAA